MNNDEAIQQLRESLRNGRTSKTSADTNTDNADNDHEARADIQDARRETRDATTDGRFTQIGAKVVGDNKRVDDEKSFRVGQTTRRPSDDSIISSPIVPNGRQHTGQIAAGNFVAVDGDTEQSRFTSFITENPTASLRAIGEKLGFSKDKAKKLRDSWQAINPPPAQPKQKTPAPQLSKKELDEKKDILKSSLESDFQYLDEYLWSREEKAGVSSDRMPVWSDMDDEELERVCAVLTRWSQKNKAVAVTVNAINDSADYIAVGMAFGPRIKRTVDKVRETRVEGTSRKKSRRVVESKTVL